MLARADNPKTAQAGVQREMLKRWFWCAVFGQAYENAPNSRSAKDVVEILQWFEGGPLPEAVTSFRFDPKALRDVTPRQRAIYRGTICLILGGGARDFHTQAVITSKLMADQGIDDHHVFPAAWLEKRGQKPTVDGEASFRPLMLATALEESETQGLNPADYVAEWKWDGIRVQLAARPGGQRRIFSRTGDDVGRAFPDIVERMAFDAVLDGELLVVRGAEVAPFNHLQQRLNRKLVTKANFYELFSGKRPFAADSPAAVLLKIVNEAAPPIVSVDVPTPLATAIARAVAKSPSDRYPRAVDFGKELKTIKSELTHPADAATVLVDRSKFRVPTAQPDPTPLPQAVAKPAEQTSSAKVTPVADTNAVPPGGVAVPLQAIVWVASALLLIVVALFVIWFIRRPDQPAVHVSEAAASSPQPGASTPNPPAAEPAPVERQPQEGESAPEPSRCKPAH